MQGQELENCKGQTGTELTSFKVRARGSGQLSPEMEVLAGATVSLWSTLCTQPSWRRWAPTKSVLSFNLANTIHPTKFVHPA